MPTLRSLLILFLRVSYFLYGIICRLAQNSTFAVKRDAVCLLKYPELKSRPDKKRQKVRLQRHTNKASSSSVDEMEFYHTHMFE